MRRADDVDHQNERNHINEGRSEYFTKKGGELARHSILAGRARVIACDPQNQIGPEKKQ